MPCQIKQSKNGQSKNEGGKVPKKLYSKKTYVRALSSKLTTCTGLLESGLECRQRPIYGPLQHFYVEI